MTTTQLTLSESQWQNARPLLADFLPETLEMVYAVMVDGQKMSDVARAHERTRQQLSYAVKKVSKIISDTALHTTSGEMKLVQVWLPADRAEDVMKEALQYEINKK